MTPLRYAELFAGAGGLSLGLDRAGLVPVFHAELADFPRRVLPHHWPDVPLYGDVTALNGRALVERHGAVDVLSGGSPCQDLSVAGKRAGIGGARSGLFFDQARLWEETGAPYLLWENVAGALSSNAGADFALVLSTLVGATVVIPEDGWRGGGVVAGPGAVAAWRLLDAQWFGVPQRRLRVFVLAARVGGCDPAEVLLEPEGVRRDTPPRVETGEGTARDAGRGTQGAREDAITFVLGSDPISRVGGAAQPVTGRNGDPGCVLTPAVLAFNQKQDGSDADVIAPTLLAMPHDGSHANGGGQLAVCLTGEVTHALTHEGHDASEDGTGRGKPIVYTRQSHAEYAALNVASTLSARDYKSATDLITEPCAINNDSRAAVTAAAPPLRAGERSAASVFAGVPRRLLPVECERLMGWPDGWTDVPDEHGKPASDAARYKACGNGVVSHCTEWIGARLQMIHDATMDFVVRQCAASLAPELEGVA